MDSKIWKALVVPFCLSLMAGCGGGGGNKNTGGGGNGSVTPPVIVSLGAGQNASGVNITVPTPASTPTPNAQALGVGGNTAFSTGDSVAHGTNTSMLIFGPGISSSMQISFSGPAGDITTPAGDITTSNVVDVKSNGTPPVPGIQFDISVSGAAAVGARTVILQDKNNDITTFTGGLEVQ
ncbi:MAG: hypothetical protein DMG73_11595 [Acidobacteria bacterium]|nr:MAG: hypothetical protein DMG73_11595 [Acidobacteriota bacterium]